MIVFMGADGSIGVNVCVCVWRSLEAPFRSCRDALRMKLIFILFFSSYRFYDASNLLPLGSLRGFLEALS